MNETKLGFHVVVVAPPTNSTDEPSGIYASWSPRTENDRECFDNEWQSVGFFPTRREAREFEEWLRKLVDAR